ncbi:hypothetical protein K461DRAFT_279960 [Myriangium duriaei CBS 260.36]|uniref:Uncharacterized protein n=1 Tax=Myriangium duriaei CBS 260.36 TaxID=1168546 RepID=A0A9P4IWZ1_9PEZI|nr:hypothetical protein K461DRAFT_279960 [Myriangium duriaei CBS 260.36]
MRTPTRSKSVAFDVPGSESPDRRRKSRSRPRDFDEEMDPNNGDAEYLSDGGRKRRRRRDRRSHRDDTASDSDVYPPRQSDELERDRRRRSERTPRGNDRQQPSSGAQTQRSTLERRNTTGSVDSESTVDLPPRFDNEGRKMPERGDDPLTDKLNDILAGRGTAGSIFRRLTGDLLGGGEDRGERRSRRGR